MFISFHHEPLTPTWLSIQTLAPRENSLVLIEAWKTVLQTYQPCLAWMLFFNTLKRWGFFPFLFTSNSLDIHCEVCQTFIKSLFFATIWKCRSSVKPAHSGLVSSSLFMPITAKKERFTPCVPGLIDLYQLRAISRHMDTHIYLMESLLPQPVLFSIQICFKWTGKTMQNHLRQYVRLVHLKSGIRSCDLSHCSAI